MELSFRAGRKMVEQKFHVSLLRACAPNRTGISILYRLRGRYTHNGWYPPRTPCGGVAWQFLASHGSWPPSRKRSTRASSSRMSYSAFCKCVSLPSLGAGGRIAWRMPSFSHIRTVQTETPRYLAAFSRSSRRGAMDEQTTVPLDSCVAFPAICADEEPGMCPETCPFFRGRPGRFTGR